MGNPKPVLSYVEVSKMVVVFGDRFGDGDLWGCGRGAQSRKIPRLVLVTQGPAGQTSLGLIALRDGLRELGWIDGKISPSSGDRQKVSLTVLALSLMRWSGFESML